MYCNQSSLQKMFVVVDAVIRDIFEWRLIL